MPGGIRTRWGMAPCHGAPRSRRGRPGASVASEPPRQLDVEGVEVDVADPLEELGGPGVGQGLGQLVAPGLVFGLQLAELGQGRGPPRRPRPRPGRPPLLGYRPDSCGNTL